MSIGHRHVSQHTQNPNRISQICIGNRIEAGLFSQAGWTVNPRSHSYFPSIDDDGISCSLVRAREMGSHITNGGLNTGLTGQDWLAGTNSDIEIISHLVYSKSSDQPCR